MKPTRTQIVVAAFTVFFCAGMIGGMLLSEPYNGEVRVAHVLTVNELNRLGRPGTNFLLPVYTDIPQDTLDKCAFYLEPGDKVMVDGVTYNWYRILREDGKHYWVYGSFIRFD